MDKKCTCTKYTGSGFEWVLDITNSKFSKNVDSNGFGVVDFIDAHKRLDKHRLHEVDSKST